MLAFSGCYYGGGEKERYELGEIRKRWETLPVRLQSFINSHLDLLFISHVHVVYKFYLSPAPHATTSII